MESLWLIESEIFQHPFTCMISGPTQSGKTFLLKQILINNQIMIDPPPEIIIYCYSAWQPIYDELKNTLNNIEFHQGIYDDYDNKISKLIIFDDLMKECENDKTVLNLFTIDAHHKNSSVFFLTQNLFSKGKYMRSLSLNSNYLIIFKNPRDKSQINVLARQMFPNKVNFFMESFQDAVENKKHSYLFLDLKQTQLEKNRIQTGILPGEERLIYTPK